MSTQDSNAVQEFLGINLPHHLGDISGANERAERRDPW